MTEIEKKWMRYGYLLYEYNNIRYQCFRVMSIPGTSHCKYKYVRDVMTNAHVLAKQAWKARCEAFAARIWTNRPEYEQCLKEYGKLYYTYKELRRRCMMEIYDYKSIKSIKEIRKSDYFRYYITKIWNLRKRIFALRG